MNRPSGSTVTYRMGEIVDKEACVAGLCVPEATVQAAVLVAFGLATLAVLVGLAYVYEGEDALAAERERVREERDAFRRFATRVEGVSAAGNGGVSNAPVITRTKPPDSGIRAVTDAYRETVMGVDHFDEEYGEGLVTNVSAELSREVAAALADEERLTPQLRGALVTQAREAAVRREELLDALDGEAAALETASERLRAVETEVESVESTRFLEHSFEELQATYGRLQSLREDCEAVIADRQETVHGDSPGPERTNGPAFRQYIYDSLDVQFPVLADGAELVERIDDAESKVVRSLLRRV